MTGPAVVTASYAAAIAEEVCHTGRVNNLPTGKDIIDNPPQPSPPVLPSSLKPLQYIPLQLLNTPPPTLYNPAHPSSLETTDTLQDATTTLHNPLLPSREPCVLYALFLVTTPFHFD